MERSQRFRDVGFSISGSAVSELVRNFSETWLMERGQPPPLPPAGGDVDPHPRRSGQADVVIVSGGPHHSRSYIRNAFMVSIASAAEEILIATPYFVPGPRMIRSLLRAARRGVTVRLLLPARSDVPLVRLLGRSYYGALLGKGIEIRELDREILHAKVMLIDGERTVIGSANLDQRSFHRNYELNSIIDDRTFGGQIRRMLLKDFEEFPADHPGGSRTTRVDRPSPGAGDQPVRLVSLMDIPRPVAIRRPTVGHSMTFGIHDVAEKNGEYHHEPAKKRPEAESLPQENKRPEGVQDGFKHRDENTFHGRHFLDRHGIADIGQPKLEHTQEQKTDPVGYPRERL